jgi:hypothetical protein
MALGLEARFNLRDGGKPITFMGWFLGEASSQQPDSTRWTDLALYRTEGGAYILEKVGRSDVFHGEDCDREGRNGKPMSKGKRFTNLEEALSEEDREEYFSMNDRDLADFFVPCDECSPSYDDQPVWVERDIFSAPVYDSPEKVINALFQSKGGNRYLSRIARELLEQAVAKDKQLAAALAKPVEIA